MHDIAPATLKPARRQTLTQYVYDQLAAAIAAGRLAPGQKLVIDALAQQLAVSITPVREALMWLQREGLVVDVPFTGTSVSKHSLEELRELHEMRGVLEGYATRLALGRFRSAELDAIQQELQTLDEAAAQGDVARFREHNVRFHETILRPGCGPQLQALLAQLKRNTDRYRIVAESILDQAYLNEAQAEHRRLVALLRRRRGEAAEALTRRHALTFVTHLARCMAAHGDPADPTRRFDPSTAPSLRATGTAGVLQPTRRKEGHP
jgi:DNA-binding GntR family transcriptional regulator